ncbi:MAG TPA: hypothetical protein VG457_02185 [Planctomycetota bacterium]|nr:hypothetical protein [Planctomycetota bacterium]
MADNHKQKEFERRIGDIEQRAAEALPGDALVIYSAYEMDAEGLPVDNLDQVAVAGRCRFVQKNDPFFGRGEDYQSPTVSSPTWLQLCRLANEMILATGDQHHVFLEGVSELREENGVKVFQFEMGS